MVESLCTQFASNAARANFDISWSRDEVLVSGVFLVLCYVGLVNLFRPSSLVVLHVLCLFQAIILYGIIPRILSRSCGVDVRTSVLFVGDCASKN